MEVVIEIAIKCCRNSNKKHIHFYEISEQQVNVSFTVKSSNLISGVRRKFPWGCFIQWHMVVICIWCEINHPEINCRKYYCQSNFWL